VTHAEQRIVEFLFSSNATEMADLPDWFLALGERDGGHELMTTASFPYSTYDEEASHASVRQTNGISLGVNHCHKNSYFCIARDYREQHVNMMRLLVAD
jgi:hypothetical protein